MGVPDASAHDAHTGSSSRKTLAGLGLYAVVVGVPLLVFIIWARLAGACGRAV